MCIYNHTCTIVIKLIVIKVIHHLTSDVVLSWTEQEGKWGGWSAWGSLGRGHREQVAVGSLFRFIRFRFIPHLIQSPL